MDETLSSVTEGFVSAGSTIVQQTSSFVNWVKSFATWENLFRVIGACLILFVFWIVYKIIVRSIKKVPVERLSKQRSAIILKFAKYIFYVLIVMYVLSLFGIKLSAIWGAAGIAGVAIGFAAQTSVSNLISGLFVLTEGAIRIGDTIIVDGITGVVDSVNLISVTVHTLDNEMVRIPNSTIINANLMNKSIHSKRRITVTLETAYEDDLELALATYIKAAKSCPTVLQDPEPVAWVNAFGGSGIEITVAAWFKPEDFLKTKNDLHIALMREKAAVGLNTPYPHMDVNITNQK